MNERLNRLHIIKLILLYRLYHATERIISTQGDVPLLSGCCSGHCR